MSGKFVVIAAWSLVLSLISLMFFVADFKVFFLIGAIPLLFCVLYKAIRISINTWRVPHISGDLEIELTSDMKGRVEEIIQGYMANGYDYVTIKLRKIQRCRGLD